MKTLVIAMGVLALTTTVYGLNKERLQKFYTNLEKCTEEIGGALEAPIPPALRCACERDGKIINEKGEMVRDAALKALEDGISDPSRLKQAQDIYNKCHDEADTNKVTGHDQALKICTCFIPSLGLLDKL